MDPTPPPPPRMPFEPKEPASSPNFGSSVPPPIESDWAPVMEFTATDIFQYSPFGDILNSLKSLSLSGEPGPNYGLRGWDSDDEEIQSPPTAHLIAIVNDISDMLDFGSEDFDGMDDEGGDEQEPAPVGRWTATSSYDIYMVDPKKEGEGDETGEDATSKNPQNPRRRRPPPKPRHNKN